MRVFGMFLGTLLISGCGMMPSTKTHDVGDAEVPRVTKVPMNSMAVTTMAELPECTENNNRQLVYVIEDKQFKTCQNGNWQIVDVAETVSLQSPSARDIYLALSGIKAGMTMDEVPADAKKILALDSTKLSDWANFCGSDSGKRYQQLAQDSDFYIDFDMVVFKNKVAFVNYAIDKEHTEYAKRIDCDQL